MSKIRVDFDVRNDTRVLQDIHDAIEFGIRSGATRIGADAEVVARERIRQAGAIWRGILINSFDWRIEKTSGRLRVIVQNDAEQARPLEFGAEYTDRAPPLAPLIPWVKTKMVGFSLENVDDLPEPEDIRADLEVEYEDGNSMTLDMARFTDDVTLQKAFFLQQHIKEEGIDAIRFMEAAEQEAARTASRTVADHISNRLRSI